MSYLEKNLSCLKKSNERLYSHLLDIIDDNEKIKHLKTQFVLINSRDGEKTIGITDKNKNVISLNSKYNPRREAYSWSKRYIKNKIITSLIIYGFGNGIIFDAIKDKLVAEACVYVYEPDIELFLFSLINFDMVEYLNDRRIAIYVPEVNVGDLYIDLCRKTDWMMAETQVICVHPKYDMLYKKNYIAFKDIIYQYGNAIDLSRNTAIVHSKKFTVNALKNLHFIKDSNYIGEFIGKINIDVPIIIVSAGPSLDKNIDELKKAEGKAFILSTDTAVQYLLVHKIKFDAIVTVDGNKMLDQLGDITCRDKCIFTSFDSKNELLEKNCGRKIWISGYGFFEKIYKKYGYIFPKYISGGSVATAAFWIAKVLEFRTIILVGQDLAYQGEYTHAGSIAVNYPKNTDDEIYIDGIYGGEVKSRTEWVRYLQWFENIISRLESGINVIDATEGGAKIKGTISMRLSVAIEKYCNQEFNFDNTISDMRVTFSEVEYKELRNDFYNMMGELEIILEKAREGVALCQQIMGSFQLPVNMININVILSRISYIQDTIEKQNIYMLIDEYIAGDVADEINRLAKADDEIEKFNERVKAFKCLFTALINAVYDLKPIVEEVLKKI